MNTLFHKTHDNSSISVTRASGQVIITEMHAGDSNQLEHHLSLATTYEIRNAIKQRAADFRNGIHLVWKPELCAKDCYQVAGMLSWALGEPTLEPHAGN